MKQPAEEEVNGSIVVEDIGSGMLAGLRYQDQDVIGLRIGGPVLASVLNEIPEITEHRGGSDTRCRS